MSKYVDVFDLEFPDGSEQATIPPTGFISLPIHHTLSTQFNDLPPLTWPAQSGETARAYDVKVWATAVRGDGRTYQSRAISWLFDGL